MRLASSAGSRSLRRPFGALDHVGASHADGSLPETEPSNRFNYDESVILTSTQWTIDGDAALRRLVDLEQIRDVVSRYFRGVDRRDWATVASCYHDGATDDHSPFFSGTGEQFLAWAQEFLPSRFRSTMHLGGQPLVDIEDDRAESETYVVAYHRSHAHDDGRVTDLVTGGRLLDRFERRGDEWRIAHRRLRVDWVRHDAVEDTSLEWPAR